jgi:hypothetical protein
MAAGDKWAETRKGLDKWFRLLPYFGTVYILLDILPYLPDSIAKKIVDKLLAAAGLGE